MRHIGYFDHLKADARNVTDSMTFPTKSGNQNFIVFLEEVQAPVVGDEGRDFLAILDQLDPHALPDGGVGLLGLNPYFLQHDALGVRGASEGVGLERRAQVGLLVLLVVPLLVALVAAQLPGGAEPTALAHPASARA
uniref:Uncharacterized protein n=1 Tax=Oryctolagus cuniculus TaxID=9986 RepID=G1U046_RABIT